MSHIQVQDDQGVRIISFNRPDKRNALDLNMYKQLTEYLIEGEADNDIRAFMLHGQDNCFTSGNDIADFLKNSDLGPNHPAVRFLFCLLELKKPLVAAVSGSAVGIGTTVLLHCVILCMPITLPNFNYPLLIWHSCLRLVPAYSYLNSLVIKKRQNYSYSERVLMPIQPIDLT